jgi:hypothetical protein
MMRTVISAIGIASFFLCLTTNAQSPDEEQAVTIPLKEIWGFSMPGTRDLQKIEDRRAAKQIEEIRGALSTRPPQGKKAKAGFAVVGTGLEALREAHAVLVEGRRPRDTFPAYSDISVAFSSHQFSYYVHISKVERRGNVVAIKYGFVPHATKELTEHFALIPLGKLPPGKMQISLVQMPLPKEFIDLQRIDRKVVETIVCQPFSFAVE